MTVGCTKLSRREAKHQIDEALKVTPRGSKKIPMRGYLPGFKIDEDGVYSINNFRLGTDKTFANDVIWAPLDNALEKTGYITINVLKRPGTNRYGLGEGEQIVALTEKGRNAGFECYGDSRLQCNLPPLIEAQENAYEITGISQDEVRAKVNILIPWKLTPLAIELKPYASTHGTYEEYWEKALLYHAESGKSPTTILFQKFDDGWRIVDENGKSEKDVN